LRKSIWARRRLSQASWSISTRKSPFADSDDNAGFVLSNGQQLFALQSFAYKSEAMRGRAQDELFCQLRHGQARALIVTEVLSGSGFAPSSRLLAAY
jgi:hypothetical protein